jgi:hypothetical protein
MPKNIQFHALAISIISLVIVVIYMLMGPNPSNTAPGAGIPTDRYIRISNATWGLSCNALIDELARTAAPLAKDANGKVIPAEPLKRVTADNVLPLIKATCDGKVSCQISATDEALGVSLTDTCYKKLTVNYRCTDLERIVTLEIDQGQWLKLDCAATAAAAPNASASSTTHP